MLRLRAQYSNLPYCAPTLPRHPRSPRHLHWTIGIDTLLQYRAHRASGSHPETSLKLIRDFLESFVIVVLVVAGIAGILYHVFRQAGWGTVIVDKTLELYFLHPVPMISATAVAVVAGVLWQERRSATGKYNKKFATYVLYVLIAVGVYFIGRYAIRGTL